MKKCIYCSTEEDLRPYGPRGSWVCFTCAHATAERVEATNRALGVALDAALSVSKIVVISEDGYVPLVTHKENLN